MRVGKYGELCRENRDVVACSRLAVLSTSLPCAFRTFCGNYHIKNFHVYWPLRWSPIVKRRPTLVLTCRVFSLLGALLNFWTDVIDVRHLVAKFI